MSLPVALQLYSVREELARDFEGTIKKVSEMGYQGVEFAGISEYSADQIKSVLKKYGLFCRSSHIPLSDLIADADGIADKCIDIGIKYVVIPYLGDGIRPGQPGFVQTLTDIAKIGEALKKKDLVLLYHNHDFEFVKIGGKYGLDYMYDTVPADLLQTQLDTCWVNVGGENPSAYIDKYSGRSPVVHLKDFIMKGREKPKKLYELIGIESDGSKTDEEDFSFMPVGSGVQDFNAILASCLKAGTELVVVEQDSPSKGQKPMDEVKKSRDYLLSLGW